MVMEFAEGGAIVGRNTLTPERPLPEALAQFYFRQMAAGLAYLHEHHVVHGAWGGHLALCKLTSCVCMYPSSVCTHFLWCRPGLHCLLAGDVKPENVMLCGGGAVKIGDFGQSQFFDRRDTFRRTLGTPAYLGGWWAKASGSLDQTLNLFGTFMQTAAKGRHRFALLSEGQHGLARLAGH